MIPTKMLIFVVLGCVCMLIETTEAASRRDVSKDRADNFEERRRGGDEEKVDYKVYEYEGVRLAYVTSKGTEDGCIDIHGTLASRDQVYDILEGHYSALRKNKETRYQVKTGYVTDCVRQNAHSKLRYAKYRVYLKQPYYKNEIGLSTKTCTEPKAVFCLLGNKIDKNSPCYKSKCRQLCNVKEDGKTTYCSCTEKHNRLEDDRITCVDGCLKANCDEFQEIRFKKSVRYFCDYTQRNNTYCYTNTRWASKLVYMHGRELPVSHEDLYKEVLGYITPKLQPEKIKTQIINQLAPAAASYSERCDHSSEETTKFCQLFDLYQQLQTLYGQKLQLIKHDGRILTSREWEDVGLKRYLKEMVEDLNTKRNHIDKKATMVEFEKGVNSKAMGAYFEKLAKQDVKVGEADFGFIKSELARLKKGSEEVFGQIRKYLKTVLTKALAMLAAEVAERLIEVALTVGQCFNPFAVVAGNCDVAAIKGAIEDLGDATKRLSKAGALMKALDELFAKATTISAKYQANEAQYGPMVTMVEAMQSGNEKIIRTESDRFLRQYAAYTPALTAQEVTYVMERFNTLVDIGCGLKDSASGAVVNVAQTAMAAVKDECDFLPALMAKFASYHEELYSFQFEFIDAMVGVVRSKVAQSYAKEIYKKVAIFPALKISRGFISDLIKINRVGIIYCNYLEYMNGGQRPDYCKVDVFDDDDLKALIDKEVPKPKLSTYNAKLPTKEGKKSGNGFLNLKVLLQKGEEVFIQLPNDPDWLVKNKWIADKEKLNSALTIHKFEVFIPHLSSDPGCKYKFQAKFSSTNSSQLYKSEGAVTYVVPRQVFRLRGSSDSGNCQNLIEDPTDSKRKVCVLSPGDMNNPDGLVPPPSMFAGFKGKFAIKGKCMSLKDEDLEKIEEVTVRVTVGEIAGVPDLCFPNPCGKNKYGKQKKCTNGKTGMKFTCE